MSSDSRAIQDLPPFELRSIFKPAVLRVGPFDFLRHFFFAKSAWMRARLIHEGVRPLSLPITTRTHRKEPSHDWGHQS